MTYWLTSSTEREQRAQEWANKYMEGPSQTAQKEVLKNLITIYLENHISYQREVIQLTQEFDTHIPAEHKEYHYQKTSPNLYPEIINLLTDFFPQVPHFFGLTQFSAKTILGNPQVLFALRLLQTIQAKGYQDAFSMIGSDGEWNFIFSRNERERNAFVFLSYLLGLVYRKNNHFSEALSQYQRGIVILKDGVEISTDNRLLLSELHRGSATVYRKQASKAKYEEEKQAFKARAEESYEHAISLLKGIANRTPTSDKVGSDIYFSYGYYEFETFFVDKTHFHQPNVPKAEAILDLFANSYRLNPSFTAALSRKAILELYLKRTDEAIRDFMTVLEEDLLFLKKRNDNERRLTVIWCSLALFHIKVTIKDFHWDGQMYINDIHGLVSAALDNEHIYISRGPLECHTFDLNVIDNIFSMQNHPIINPELRKVIRRLNDELGKF